MKSTNDVIKKMNQQPCSIPECGKEQFVHVGVPIVSITESGKIEFPYDNKEQSAEVSIPMCGYHFAMMGECETFLFGVTMENNSLIVRSPEWIKKYEAETTKDLKEGIKEEKSNPEKSESIKIIKGILAGRKFEEGLKVHKKQGGKNE